MKGTWERIYELSVGLLMGGLFIMWTYNAQGTNWYWPVLFIGLLVWLTVFRDARELARHLDRKADPEGSDE